MSTVSLDNDIQTPSSSTLVAGGKNMMLLLSCDLSTLIEGVRPNVQATSSPKPEVLHSTAAWTIDILATVLSIAIIIVV